MMRKLILISALLLSACVNSDEGNLCVVSDHAKAHQYFMECLEKVKVNRDVNYNDTDEMIDSCKSAAWSMTTRYGSIKHGICVFRKDQTELSAIDRMHSVCAEIVSASDFIDNDAPEYQHCAAVIKELSNDQ